MSHLRLRSLLRLVGIVALWIAWAGMCVYVWGLRLAAQGRSYKDALLQIPWLWLALATTIVLLLWFGIDPASRAAIAKGLAERREQAIVCPRCSMPNAPQSISCGRCGRMLDWPTVVISAIVVVSLLGVSWAGARP